MDEGKDIVGLAIPFAAGTGLGGLCEYFAEQFCISFSPYLYGSILFLCTVVLLTLVSVFRPRKFYVYAIMFCILGLCSYGTMKMVEVPDFSILGRFELMARELTDRMKEMIDCLPYEDERVRGLVRALTTGDRSGLDRETVRIFRQAGAAHILALSGLHLGIIYLLLKWLLIPLGKAPAAECLRSALLVGICGYYSVATGRSPSIMRAFLFITINEASHLMHIRPSPIRTLCSALTLQLTANPGIIHSIGFQLSYLAMAGISTLYPVFLAWYPKDTDGITDKYNIPLKLWQTISLTTSCQIFTAPIVWLHFHIFPKYFLITNLIASPITLLVMLTSILTIFLFAIGLCPQYIVKINEQVCILLINTLNIISQL